MKLIDRYTNRQIIIALGVVLIIISGIAIFNFLDQKSITGVLGDCARNGEPRQVCLKNNGEVYDIKIKREFGVSVLDRTYEIWFNKLNGQTITMKGRLYKSETGSQIVVDGKQIIDGAEE